MQLPEATTYRLALLEERAKTLQAQLALVVAERDKILRDHGLFGKPLMVIVDPGQAHPVGTVVDPQTNQPYAGPSQRVETMGNGVSSASVNGG